MKWGGQKEPGTGMNWKEILSHPKRDMPLEKTYFLSPIAYEQVE